MKLDTVKILFVYGNVTFIVIAGFYVLYQLAANATIDPARAAQIGVASIFAGFVGMAIQFLTGSEIAKRAEVAATNAFQTGAGSLPTVATTSGQSTATVTPPTSSQPAQNVELETTTEDDDG